MWNYIKRYLPFAILAALFMIGEVMMDLIQPGLMRRIVDDGVLGISTGGAGDLNLIWNLGIQMILLVLFGGICGSMNNVFVHMSGQNIGNEIRKDCFRKIMTFSFPQLDRFGTGSLVTRVTNDIAQVQNYISQFVRGMIRTTLLTFGSMYFMFRLNVTFGLIVLCAFPFIIACIAFCLLKANPLFEQLQTHLDAINAIMQEDISGIRMIKACVRQIFEKLRFGKANDALIKTQLRTLVIFAFMNPVVNALMYLAIAAILLAGSVQVGTGATAPGAIMAAITYSTQLLNGVLMLVMLFQNISRGYVSWKRVKEVLDSAPELKGGRFDGNRHKGAVQKSARILPQAADAFGPAQWNGGGNGIGLPYFKCRYPHRKSDSGRDALCHAKPYQHCNRTPPVNHSGRGYDRCDGSRKDRGKRRSQYAVGAKGQVLRIIYDAIRRGSDIIVLPPSNPSISDWTTKQRKLQSPYNSVPYPKIVQSSLYVTSNSQKTAAESGCL